MTKLQDFQDFQILRCSVKKDVPKNLRNFSGNTCFEKLQYRCFAMKFRKSLRTPILKNICKRLFPNPSQDLQNLIITSFSNFRAGNFFCIITINSTCLHYQLLKKIKDKNCFKGLKQHSIMRLTRQFQACLFFLTKRFCAHKSTSQAKISQQNKITHALNNKGNNFLRAKTFKRIKVVCFAFWCFLCSRNLFVKRNKQA